MTIPLFVALLLPTVSFDAPKATVSSPLPYSICRAQAASRLNYPATFKLQARKITNKPETNETVVILEFEATNAFGVPANYRIACSIIGNKEAGVIVEIIETK